MAASLRAFAVHGVGIVLHGVQDYSHGRLQAPQYRMLDTTPAALPFVTESCEIYRRATIRRSLQRDGAATIAAYRVEGLDPGRRYGSDHDFAAAQAPMRRAFADPWDADAWIVQAPRLLVDALSTPLG